ncbi:MAG: kynureninase [Candidatus Neomarinimicrobiota bacterium]
MMLDKSKSFALTLDQNDALGKYRSQFCYPKNNQGDELIYLCGNSLGLQPKSAEDKIKKELSTWANEGVLGQDSRWIAYHEKLTKASANLVGANNSEVVVMNALTVNIHLLLISFYQPDNKKYKILMEKNAFPSDQYAIQSQIQFHGYDINDALIEIGPHKDEKILRHNDIIEAINKHGDELALVYLGGLNYYTGQALQMKEITFTAKKRDVMVGFNLAHSAGNVLLNLHDWGVDFAAWCSYKYLCGGPGAPSGVFIHERHHEWKGPRLLGWWGHDKRSRFDMPSSFTPIPSSEAWQISNAPVMGMAPLIASMNIYDEIGMESIHRKGIELSNYLEFLLSEYLPQIKIITPKDRGCQLSIMIPDGKEIFDFLQINHVVCDWRNPDVIRVAPHPLFNTFIEVFTFVDILRKAFNYE